MNKSRKSIVQRTYLPEDLKMAVMEALDHVYLSHQYQVLKSPNQIPEDGNLENVTGLVLKDSQENIRENRNSKYHSASAAGNKILVSEGSGICGKDPSQQQRNNVPSDKPTQSKRTPNSYFKPFAKNYGSKNVQSMGSLGIDVAQEAVADGREYNPVKGLNDINENKANWDAMSTSALSESHSGSGTFQKSPLIHKVTCMYRESSNRYWVMNVTNLSTYEEVQRELLKGGEVVENPEIGKVYGCEYEGEMYRAKVLNVLPKLVVHFIDFGNNHSYECASKCRKLPVAIQKIPGLVFLVEFDEGTPHKYFTEDLDTKFLVIKKTGKISVSRAQVVLILRGPFGCTVKSNNRIGDLEDQRRQQRKRQQPLLPLQPLLPEPDPLKQSNNYRGRFNKTFQGEGQAPPHEKEENWLSSGEPPTEDSKPVLPIRKKIYSKKCIIDEVTETTKGTIFFLPGRNNIRFGIIVPEKYGNADSYLDTILSLNTSNMTPTEVSEGDFALVSHVDDVDHVCRVLNCIDGSYYVHLMDLDTFVQVNQVFSIPKGIHELFDHGALFVINDWFSPDALSSVKLKFEITGKKSGDKWPCCLKSELGGNVVGMGTIEKAQEAIYGEFVSIFLKSPCRVQITAVGSSNTLFVRKLGDKMKRKFLQSKEKLAAYAPTGTFSLHAPATCVCRSCLGVEPMVPQGSTILVHLPPFYLAMPIAGCAANLSFPPEIGDLCCVRFMGDNLYYRGQVLKAEKDTMSVLLVDIGLIQDTFWRTLKPLSSELKSMPFLAAEVTLANVPVQQFETEVKKYLEKLRNESSEFILTYENYLEGVFLAEKATNKNINQIVKGLMSKRKESPEPSINNPIEAKTTAYEATSSTASAQKEGCYHDSDLRSLDIKCGEKYDFVLLHVDDEEYEMNYSFWMTDRNDPTFVYVNSTLAEEIEDYCQTVKEPHKPRIGEVCLAEFDGIWYRGSTIDANPERDEFLVMFIDFGNICTLTSSSIRRMQASFMKPPVLAYCCNIVDFERIGKNPELKVKVQGFLKGKVNDFFPNVEVCKYEDDSFAVRIPEIEDMIAGKE